MEQATRTIERVPLRSKKSYDSVLNDLLNYLVIPLGILLLISFARSFLFQEQIVAFKDILKKASEQESINIVDSRDMESASLEIDLQKKSVHEKIKSRPDSDPVTLSRSIDSRIKELRTEYKVRAGILFL